MAVSYRVTVATIICAFTYGCMSLEVGVPIAETITADVNNPKRYWFVVHGDPGLDRYPIILALPLPMHEKIQEGMRRYAADELIARGLCPNGFVGPDLVTSSSRGRMTRRFWVDCR